MESFDVDLFPRLDLDPEQYRRLGEALAGWLAARPAGEVSGNLSGLDALLAGAPPDPSSIRRLDMIEQERAAYNLPPLTGAERKAQLAEFLRLPEAEPCTPAERALVETLRRLSFARAISWRMHGRKAEAGASLRAAIPAQLVQTVRIDGEDWREL